MRPERSGLPRHGLGCQPDLVGDVGLGMQVRFGNGIEMLGEYQSQIGDRFLSHTGSIRLQARL